LAYATAGASDGVGGLGVHRLTSPVERGECEPARLGPAPQGSDRLHGRASQVTRRPRPVADPVAVAVESLGVDLSWDFTGQPMLSCLVIDRDRRDRRTDQGNRAGHWRGLHAAGGPQPSHAPRDGHRRRRKSPPPHDGQCFTSQSSLNGGPLPRHSLVNHRSGQQDDRRCAHRPSPSLGAPTSPRPRAVGEHGPPWPPSCSARRKQLARFDDAYAEVPHAPGLGHAGGKAAYQVALATPAARTFATALRSFLAAAPAGPLEEVDGDRGPGP